MNKLEGFPPIYYISLEESTDRRENLENQFKEHGITNYTPMIFKRFAECNDVIHGPYVYTLYNNNKGASTSHLKSIRKWLTETDEPYGVFVEDDISFKTVQYWNFTWKDFMNHLPDDWEAVQLMWVRTHMVDIEFRERYIDDWSASAFMIKRSYGQKLVDKFVIGDEEFNYDMGELQPIVENILYTSGKVYTVPLLIEETTLPTTSINTPEEDPNLIINGQVENHHTSYDEVLNWWKNNSNNALQKLMKIEFESPKNLQTPLERYVYDTENPILNFELARWYHDQGQTAAAVSFYLRCADRTEDLDLAYESLIHAAACFARQSNRDYTVKGLYQQAISILPNRPEAYYLLCKHEETRSCHAECYTLSSIALKNCNFESTPLRHDVGYPGKYAILFERSVSAYWWGKWQESKSIICDLIENYNVDQDHLNCLNDNIKRCFPELLTKVNDIGKIDIVLQGAIDPSTKNIVDSYLKLDFVEKIIVSTWEGEDFEYDSDRVTILKNKKPETPGTDNRNLQIVGSNEGLRLVNTEYAAKMRTDQKYTSESMTKMYDYMANNRVHDDQIFVAGIYPGLLFHPRDHIFWGRTSDLKELYDIPLEYNGLSDKMEISKEDLWKYYPFFVRTETYIGVRYCKKFDERIKVMLIEPEKYLHDDCGGWNQSHKISNEVIRRAFKSFPREGINLEWDKKGWKSYPYDDQKNGYGECWSEDGF